MTNQLKLPHLISRLDHAAGHGSSSLKAAFNWRVHIQCSGANQGWNKQCKNEMSKHLWVTCTLWRLKTKRCCCALLTTWSSMSDGAYCCCLIARCVFFRKPYQGRRKTEWAPLTVALLDHRLDRIKWFPLLHPELLLPSVRLQLKPRLLFLAMFASGRNFRRFNGTWAIVHSLLYGTLPSFPQGEREKKRTEGCV